MTDEPATRESFSHLDKRTLADLLTLCLDAATDSIAQEPDQQKAECLQDLLAQPLAYSPTDGQDASIQNYNLPGISGFEPTVCLRELLLSPETDITVLQCICRHGKTLALGGPSPLEQEVGGVLYYAAIASAIVWHNQRISKLTPKELETNVKHVLQNPWLPTDLISLFGKMYKILHSGSR